MNPLRITVLALAVICTPLAVALLIPFSQAQAPTPTITPVRAAIGFVIAVGIGFALQLFRLASAGVRSRKLHATMPQDTVVLVAVWNPALGSLNPPAAPSFLKYLAKVSVSSVGVTADLNGITFWSGINRPKKQREIAWSDVDLVTTRPITAYGKTYPSVGVVLRSGREVAFQIESLKSFRSRPRTWPEVDLACGNLMRKLFQYRQNVSH